MENVPEKFQLLISLKFLFSVIKGILLLCIFFTFEENIFVGLNFVTERNTSEFLKAKDV